MDLSKLGILNVKEIIHNPSFDLLYEHELKENLTGYEKGELTNLGAVNVMTGIYTVSLLISSKTMNLSLGERPV